MAKRTIKISIKLPTGISATKELEEKAQTAAEAAIASAVSELAEAHKLAKELADKGITISPEELMSRKKTSAKRKSSGSSTEKRKRIVLSAAQRKSLIAELKAGAKIAEAADKYGISTATVMNIKTAAGLTKSRSK
ncbi:hypothetical protein [Coraliomargarita parva]|uniref:hypothetical protein n=1 Tax=Coraliomargarita parva TaxID=3014050 RepID=UPI0022B36924|nr:hypothetical protein [Coraliomargarita parva]